MKSKLFYIGTTLLVSFLLIRAYYNLTDDFRVSNILYPMGERAEWNFPHQVISEEQLKKILKQKFVYLGKGAQVYAFGSEDGKYVLKFFKFKHLKPSALIMMIPPIGPLAGWKERNIQRKERKLEGVFQGHVNAYNYDRKHSGLLYLHLNTPTHLDLQAHLVDKIGFERTVDLDSVVFILQKRGETLRAVFSELIESGKEDLAAKRANQILDMYVEEYRNGVWDRDHGISHNTGFIDDEPFHLDVGKMSYDAKMQSPEFYQQDLIHVASKMESWVEGNYPSIYPSFCKKVEAHLQELLSQPVVSESMHPL